MLKYAGATTSDMTRKNGVGNTAFSEQPQKNIFVDLIRAMIVEGGDVALTYTYAELAALVAANGLIPMQAYTISDYRTRHFIPNTSMSVVHTGSLEPITIIAASVNTFYPTAVSSNFPQDEILYEFVDSTTAGGNKGRMYYRKDVEINVSSGYDWRNVKFRRFKGHDITYNALVGVFKANETITGGTSGATARIVSDNGATLVIKMIVGVFVAAETITGGASGATANIVSMPDSGTFDNIVVTSNTAIPNFTDYFTFNNSAVALNCNNVSIGEITDFAIANYGFPSDKLNNNLMLTASYVNISEDTHSNTFNTLDHFNSDGLMFGNLFVNAVYDTKLGRSFFANISYGMSTCKIGILCSGNINLGNIDKNNIGDNFQLNTIGNTFENNEIGFNFYSNVIGDTFTYNNVKDNFSQNVVGTNALRNIFESNFSSNTLGNTITMNYFGQSFSSNTIGATLRYNKFGVACQLNTIGTNCENNTINGFMSSNTIGNFFSYNNIQHGFSNNTITHLFKYNVTCSTFSGNTIGDGFSNNTTMENFTGNTCVADFQRNNIQSLINAVDFSLASLVYATYSKRVVENNAGTNKIIYLDNGTGLDVSNPLTA